ncbi:MAG: CBS domain-containing protein [Pseudomonadota bacterium]
MNVNEAMTTPVKSAYSNTSLDAIARMMWDQNCGAIPVVEGDNQPLGIITDRDIAMAAMLNHEPLWNIPASTVIQGQRLTCCSPQESIEMCVEKMEQHSVRRILVTDDSGALCGIVSLGDAVAFTKSADRKGQEKGAVKPEQMIDMLRKVSAHHGPGEAAYAA